MTNQQILEKAIQKAIDGGWAGGDTKIKPEYWSEPNMGKFYRQQTVNGWSLNPQLIIFNHDFAKALWGEEQGELLFTTAKDKAYSYSLYGAEWQLRLMKMVIAEDPIKYLGDNI